MNSMRPAITRCQVCATCLTHIDSSSSHHGRLNLHHCPHVTAGETDRERPDLLPKVSQAAGPGKASTAHLVLYPKWASASPAALRSGWMEIAQDSPQRCHSGSVTVTAAVSGETPSTVLGASQSGPPAVLTPALSRGRATAHGSWCG